MKILPVRNYRQNSIKFTSSTSLNSGLSTNYEPPQNSDSQKNIPEWLRKSILFGLIGLAIANDPTTREFLKSESDKQQEKIQKEYFDDISKLEYPASHHLNLIGDIEKPIIKSNNLGNYVINLNLDNNKIIFSIYLPTTNSNELKGSFKLNGSRTIGYKAVFKPQKPNEFDIYIRDQNNTKYTFGRTKKGELYRLDENKKIIINKENAKKYQQELQDLQELEKFDFYTNKNDLWRKLNLILLFILTLNEWNHDLLKKEKLKNKNNEKI